MDKSNIWPNSFWYSKKLLKCFVAHFGTFFSLIISTPKAKNQSIGYFVVTVATPVTWRPPHRSRRAEFPHRAPQESSLPVIRQICFVLRAIVHSEVCTNYSSPTCPVSVSFVECIFLLTPSPCDRLSRTRSTMSQSDSL